MIKLLILEDDAEMNHALCIYFKKAGYTVLQAFHCAQAQSKKTRPILSSPISGFPMNPG